MYYLKKRMEISASHCLTLDYDSKCKNTHGHNWIITVYCKKEELDDMGMVVDFSVIKAVVEDNLDHQNLNTVLPCNPTAENIAKWIYMRIANCYKVKVQESEGNIIVYEA